MKVVLLGEIKGKGGEGDVVDVAQGYAENYLFPKKLAVAATKGNLKQLEQRRGNIAKREEKRIEDANALKASLEGKKILVEAKVGEEGILFGSVTAQMIVDRKRLELKKAIKVAGEHVVTLSIYRDIKVDLNLFVGEEKVEEPVEETEEVVEEAVEATEEAAE